MDQASPVVDNAAHHRFELVENGHLAFASYRRTGNDLVIPHVEAAMALRGTGAAGRLMAGIAAYAQANGLKITPLCSYAAAWFSRNPAVSGVLKEF